ncbi:MAG TPA: helix-turn-helix domain-containing protein [Thermomicrobiales bacterium]|nr:helix-turn-helix domain-containing protein [Thermomicrobiales bacterium]
MDTESGTPRDEAEVNRIESLLKQETYSPQEAAEILGVRERTINSAVYGGELKAYVVNHDIVSIDRADLIAWLRNRG